MYLFAWFKFVLVFSAAIHTPVPHHHEMTQLFHIDFACGNTLFLTSGITKTNEYMYVRAYACTLYIQG